MTHHWHFSKHSSETAPEGWWDTRYDIYPTAITAHVWNKVRAARILVYELLQDGKPAISSNASDEDDLTAVGKRTDARLAVVREAVTDICASIPPYWRPVQHTNATYVPPLGTAFFLLWPLSIVGGMSNAVASPDLTGFLIRVLTRIHSSTGTQNAFKVLKRIKMIQGIP